MSRGHNADPTHPPSDPGGTPGASLPPAAVRGRLPGVQVQHVLGEQGQVDTCTRRSLMVSCLLSTLLVTHLILECLKVIFECNINSDKNDCQA